MSPEPSTSDPTLTSSAESTGAQPELSGLVARVRDLHVDLSRGGRTLKVLRGIDLDIRKGEILGLVGESGSGKSVFGLALLGLLPESSDPRTAGSAVVAGVDVLTASPARRRELRKNHLGAVFQDPMTSLNPTMKIGRQVAEATGSGAEALRLLRAVGIPEPERRLASFPHELSGGLRQRVMIAMAVAGDPGLVVADEPTTALDVTVQAQVLQLLARLRDDVGCSVLLVTHDLGVAGQVADRVAVLYAGRIAEVGPTAAVLRAPEHPYTAGLLGSRLSLTTDRSRPVRTLSGGLPDPAAPLPGCAYAPRCSLVMDACLEKPPVPEPPPGEQVDHVRACLAEATDVRALLTREPEPPLPPVELAAPAGQEPLPAVALGAVNKTFRISAGGRRRALLHALRGIVLEVSPGEAVAIVGESGSGKSTLLRVVAGLEKADVGADIRLGHGGRPQMVFQDAGASLTPWMTVGAMLEERLRTEGIPRAQRRERMLEALTKVGLPETVATAKGAELSGGQRQRVALARATVVPPALLLCDEPTSALDVSLAANVLNLVQRLRRELGMAVMFVTHDLAVARIVADRIAVMYLGRIVEIGTAQELTARPKHPYTKSLLSAVPDLGVPPATLRGEPASPLAPPSGCAFHPRCEMALPQCSDEQLNVPLARLSVGAEDLADADLRRVACIRPEAI